MAEIDLKKGDGTTSHLNRSNEHRVTVEELGCIKTDTVVTSISIKAAFDIYEMNDVFRMYLDTNMFRYKAGQFCFASQSEPEDGKCVLVFTEVLTPLQLRATDADGTFQSNQRYVKELQFYDASQNVGLLDKMNAWEAQFQRIRDRQNVNISTANEMMWEYMRRAHWNTRIFQDKTLLSSMDYTRVQKKDYVFKLPAYVAMAVGLGLTLQEFQDVIEHAGLCLTRGNKQHDAYSFLLSTMQGQGIDVCNEFLRGLGLLLLGTQERAKN